MQGVPRVGGPAHRPGFSGDTFGYPVPRDYAKAFVETLTLSDAQQFDFAQGTVADTLTLSDAFADVWTAVASFADTVTLSDGFSDVWAAARTFADTVTTSDVFADVWAAQLALAETLTLADGFADVWTALLAANDTLTLSDLAIVAGPQFFSAFIAGRVNFNTPR